MNEKKICFIMCTNNAQYEAEAMHFISKLHVPQGYEIDAISIRDAKSLTSGYNEECAPVMQNTRCICIRM